MDADLTNRIRALERAVSDADDPPSPLPRVADIASDHAHLAGRVDALETRVDDIEARQAAVEAYVDQIEHVNDTVERRADAALAAVDRLESCIDGVPRPLNMAHDEPPDPESGGPAAGAREAGAEPDVPAGGQVSDAGSHISDAASHISDAASHISDTDTRVTDSAANAPERRSQSEHRSTAQLSSRKRTSTGDPAPSPARGGIEPVDGGADSRGLVDRLLGR